VREDAVPVAIAALLAKFELALERLNLHFEGADALHHAIDVFPRLRREVVLR
jgi:hypothetical protein